MTDFETQQFSASEIVLSENQTFAFVSGVAGQLARPFQPGFNSFPYWAYAGSSDVSQLHKLSSNISLDWIIAWFFILQIQFEWRHEKSLLLLQAVR